MSEEDPTVTKLPPGKCCECGTEIDSASDLNGTPKLTPVPGDIAICLHCTAVMVFEEGLTFRKITTTELLELPVQALSDLRILQVGIRAVHEKRAAAAKREG